MRSSIVSQKLKTTLITASGSWVVPSTVYGVYVSATAGGGGGARYGTSSSVYAGGGAGGHVLDYALSVVPGETLTLTVGAAGTGAYGVVGTIVGTVGGNTIIARGATVLLTLTGGFYGTAASSAPIGGGGGIPAGSGGGSFVTGGSGTKLGGPCGRPVAVTSSTTDKVVTTPLLGVNGQGPLPGGRGLGGRTPFPGYGFGGDGRSSTASANNGGAGCIMITWVE